MNPTPVDPNVCAMMTIAFGKDEPRTMTRSIKKAPCCPVHFSVFVLIKRGLFFSDSGINKVQWAKTCGLAPCQLPREQRFTNSFSCRRNWAGCTRGKEYDPCFFFWLSKCRSKEDLKEEAS